MRCIALVLLGVACLASVGYSQDVYMPGADGLRGPRPVKRARPVYPAAAIPDRIQGKVWVETVVRADGVPTDVKVVRPLDSNKYGIDAAVVAAMRQWRFTPGCKDGKSVAVRVMVNFDIQPPD